MITLAAFCPITVNGVVGFRATDRELLDLLWVLGTGPWMRCRFVTVPPHCRSSFLSGARVGMAGAVIGAVFGKLAGADAGLEHSLTLSSANLLTERLFAYVTVLAAGLFALETVRKRWPLPWCRW
jgi:ABC-type nitrate/sulfonate/bicarbonate transport system permease component